MKLLAELFELHVPSNFAMVVVSCVMVVTVQSRCAPEAWFLYLRWPLATPFAFFALKPKLPLPLVTVVWPPPVTIPEGTGPAHGPPGAGAVSQGVKSASPTT